MSSDKHSMILVASCPDKVGITQSDQFSEEDTQHFFMRYEFRGFTQELPDLETVRERFAPIAAKFDMNWDLYDSTVKPRVLLAVSKFGHCLNDLLFRWKDGGLGFDIVGVVSNHPDYQSQAEWYGLPYHYLPVTNETRPEQEATILKLIDDYDVDLFVLARYMQILSTDMCEKLAGRAINIHHSFLPSFKGARPYHQAHARGVKLIGATAHYVTSDLDEGPIIEQDVQRIEHSSSNDEVVKIGSEVECRVLARAVKWHCERRVLMSNHRTIVFN